MALALRLGMASLLGSSNLNLMILDEPTTHLDAERKEIIGRVLSQLTEISNSQTPMQFLIITHDAEYLRIQMLNKFTNLNQKGKEVKLLHFREIILLDPT